MPGTEGGNLNDNELLKKDRSYAPSSGRETEIKQDEPIPDQDGAVKALPGTGGPDDFGDIEIGPNDPIYIPHEETKQ